MGLKNADWEIGRFNKVLLYFTIFIFCDDDTATVVAAGEVLLTVNLSKFGLVVETKFCILKMSFNCTVLFMKKASIHRVNVTGQI